MKDLSLAPPPGVSVIVDSTELNVVERQAIERAMLNVSGNKARAARQLGSGAPLEGATVDHHDAEQPSRGAHVEIAALHSSPSISALPLMRSSRSASNPSSDRSSG